MKYAVRDTLLLVAGLMAFGCGDADYAPAEVAPEFGGGVDTKSQALTSAVTGEFGNYAQALLDEDLQLLDSVTSREVKERIRQVGSDTRGFAKKMRASMLNAFPSIAEGSDVRARFTIQSIRREGSALRAEVAFDGRTLPKPFYFVNEDGEYKLNVRRPGFANALPEGSGGVSDNYLIRNHAVYAVTMGCTGSGLFDAPAGADYYRSCGNKCGTFHGSQFYSLADPTLQKCDYNTWGVDVYIEGTGVLRCHDKC